MGIKFTQDQHLGRKPKLTREQIREELHHFASNPKVHEAIKKVFDRSFTVQALMKTTMVCPILRFKRGESGSNVMTVADVAAFLQTDRASVRRMTGDGAQHRGHIIRFHSSKLGAR